MHFSLIKHALCESYMSEILLFSSSENATLPNSILVQGQLTYCFDKKEQSLKCHNSNLEGGMCMFVFRGWIIILLAWWVRLFLSVFTCQHGSTLFIWLYERTVYVNSPKELKTLPFIFTLQSHFISKNVYRSRVQVITLKCERMWPFVI